VGPEFVTTRRPTTTAITAQTGPEFVKKTLPAGASSGDHTQQQERDDTARTFEHRREAYLDFYVAVKALARTAYNHGYGFNEPELPEGWQDDAFEKLTRLEFYADRALARVASEAYGSAWSWGQYGKFDEPDDPDFYERQQRYDDAELAMLGLMRARLSIPEGDLGLPPPAYSDDAGTASVLPIPNSKGSRAPLE
jgi:hypothetical protein